MSRDFSSSADASRAWASPIHASPAASGRRRRPARSAASRAASAASVACSTRVEISPPVQIGTSSSTRVIAVSSGSGSFGSPATKSGNEKRSWLRSSAKASAGESVRIQLSETRSCGSRYPFASRVRASAAALRACGRGDRRRLGAGAGENGRERQRLGGGGADGDQLGEKECRERAQV